MEIKIQIFQAWKDMESGQGCGKSWKVSQTVSALSLTVFVFWHVCALSLYTVRLGSARLT